MKSRTHRRLEANERPIRIPSTRMVIDKKTKAKKRSRIKQDTRRTIQSAE